MVPALFLRVEKTDAGTSRAPSKSPGASRIKQADFPNHKGLDSFDLTALPPLNKQQGLELTRGQWMQKRENLCMIGNGGTGQTHPATAIGLAAYDLKQVCPFYTPISQDRWRDGQALRGPLT